MLNEFQFKRSFIGDRIIVHICWHLGNLKKTYLGELRMPMSDVWSANVWMGEKIVSAEVWTCWLLNRFLNASVVLTSAGPIFEWALPTNIYDYMLPIYCQFKSTLYKLRTWQYIDCYGNNEFNMFAWTFHTI